LLEAEGRLFERRIVRLWYRLTLMIVTALLIVIGLGFWVWSGYEYMTMQFGKPTGAFVAGVIALAEAGIIVWIIHLLRR